MNKTVTRRKQNVLSRLNPSRVLVLRWCISQGRRHGGTRGPCSYWNLVPPMKRELQWKNWLTRDSLLAVKVVIVNCNGTAVVVPFVQCQ